MYCFNTNHPVLKVLKLTPRQGTFAEAAAAVYNMFRV